MRIQFINTRRWSFLNNTFRIYINFPTLRIIIKLMLIFINNLIILIRMLLITNLIILIRMILINKSSRLIMTKGSILSQITLYIILWNSNLFRLSHFNNSFSPIPTLSRRLLKTLSILIINPINDLIILLM